jgi:hypothetical protein
MVYKRYTTQNTYDSDRLGLRRHKAFWMALAGGAVSAIVLGVVLTRALRPAGVETEATAANAPTAMPTPATPASLAPVVSPTPSRMPRSPRPSPSEPALPSPSESGRFTNADLERLKREGSPPASPATRTSPSPAARAAASVPPASPSGRTARSPAAGEPPAGQPGEPGAESEEVVWRARTQRRMAAVRAAEGRLRQAQERVSTLREQVAAALAESPDNRPDLQQQLQQAEDRVAQAQKDLARAEDALDRLEDDARAAGVPLAWVKH